MAETRTARQLIEGALRKIGVIAVSETPTAEDINTGLLSLQDMLAQWAARGIIVPYVTTEAITLTIGQASYTIGKNGTPSLNAERPEQIIDTYYRDASGYDYSLKPISGNLYRGISDKTGSNGTPLNYYYNPTVPNGTLYIWPPPDVANSLYITSLKPFTEPTTLTDNMLNTYGIPRSYHNTIQWNLAVELCPEYGVSPRPDVIMKAQETLSACISMTVANQLTEATLEMPGISSATNYIRF